MNAITKAPMLIARSIVIALCVLIVLPATTRSENPKAADWFRKGQAKYRTKNWPDAVHLFSKVLQEDPQNKDALFFRGDALRQDSNLFEAIKDLRTVTEMDPDYSEAWRSLGKAYRALGRFPDELVFYKEAIRCAKDPVAKRDLEKWTMRLQEKLSQRQQKGASHEIQPILEKAQAAHNSGDLARSIAMYESALKLTPGESSIYVHLGDIYSSLDNQAKATEYYEKALLLDPGDLKLLAKFGALLYQFGDKDRALAEYEKILGKNPNNPEMHIQLGLIHRDRGSNQEAITCWKKAGELTSDVQTKTEIAALITQLEQGASHKPPAVAASDRELPAESEASIESAAVEGSAGQFGTKAAVAERAQQWDRAIIFYRKAAEADPSNPDYHYNLGVIHEIRGDWHAAAREYEQALRLNPDHVDALVGLGEINSIILDDRESALKYYERAVQSSQDTAVREKITKRIQMLQNN